MVSSSNDTAASNYLKRVPRLERVGETSNYATWAIRMKKGLDIAGVLELVLGKEEKPPESNEEAYASWKQRNARASAWICECIGDEDINLVEDLDAAPAWEALELAHNKTKVHKHLAILLSLVNLKAKQGEVLQYAVDHEELLARARSSGFPLLSGAETEKLVKESLDAMYSFFILQGLPNSPNWRAFTNAVDESGQYNPREIINKIRTKLSKIEINQISSMSSPVVSSKQTGSATALAANAQQRTGQSRPTCPTCHMKNPRHAVEDCYANPKSPKFSPEHKAKADLRKAKEKGKNSKETGGGKKEVTAAAATTSPSEGDTVHVTLAVAFTCTNGGRQIPGFYLDSCATQHICFDRSAFSTFTPMSGTVSGVAPASAIPLKVEGYGDVPLQAVVDGALREITVTKVHYVPDSPYNLLSMTRFAERNVIPIFGAGKSGEYCLVDRKNNRMIATGRTKNGLMALDVKKAESTFTANALLPLRGARINSIRAAHRVLGHPGQNAMQEMLKHGTLVGVSTTDIAEFFQEVCPVCVTAKMSSSPYPTSSRITTSAAQLMHTDVAGPFRHPSWGRSRYFVLLIDEAMDYVNAEPLKAKHEVAAAVEWMYLRFLRVAAAYNFPISESKTIRSDNGTEYTGAQFQKFLSANKITHETSIAGKPQQNGKAERTVRTIKETIASLLIDAGLGNVWWAEALKHAVSCLNRRPSASLNGEAPMSVIMKKPVDLTGIPVFGSRVWAKMPTSGTFKPHADECRFLGVAKDKKAFKVQPITAPGGSSVRYVRDIRFSWGALGGTLGVE